MLKKIWNNFKAFYNDTYGMLIVVSWAIFIICLIIKLFGGNWFELGTSNTKFIAFCEYVDNTLWLKKTLAVAICLFTTYPVYCIMLNEQKTKPIISITLIILTAFKSFIGWYNTIISFILDIFILLVLMTIFNKNFKRNIICFVIINAMQILMLLVRNLDFGFGNFTFANTFVEQAIYQIDYYLMIVLFYLYNFKRKKKVED